MERNNSHDLLFRVTAAVCLSSVTDGTARVSLALGASVTAAVILAGAVMLLTSLITSRGTARLCGVITAVCAGVSFALVAGSFLGQASLSAGVFTAAAVCSSLILGVYSDTKYNMTGSVLGSALFTVTLTAAGVIREVFGTGTLFGFDIGLAESLTVGVLNAPSGGMVVCSVAAALLQCVAASRKELTDVE